MTGEPNQAQTELWNSGTGRYWADQADRLDTMLCELGEKAMDVMEIGPGDRVLDVGCGAGATTLELARRVGVGGTVLGIDISEPLLDLARGRAESADAFVGFERVDAQTAVLPENGYDAIFSRFGVMFFADPVVAFRNLGRALDDGGCLGFVAWREPAENPWVTVPASVLRDRLSRRAAPGQPSPFAFSDRDRVEEILDEARMARVRIEPLDMTIPVGDGTIDGAAETMLAILEPRTDPDDPSDAQRVHDLLAEAFAPLVVDGQVQVEAAAWLVTAVR
ncbi:MAG: methyltransferase domain-containing protein [Actinomycetia bacterium]|nr:methyltransferase domain-containing protein [Actinomycetes bacterium]MCP4087652.1 methyltransferase domain-containing protein [Actinomycetes bacterium]